MHNLYCFCNVKRIFASEGKQYGTVNLTPYLNHYHNELPQKFTQHENINHLINRQ